MSSIVMDDAVIEPGAVVARSIIGPGMRVKAGSRVIDAIVADPKISQEIKGKPGPSTDGGSAT